MSSPIVYFEIAGPDGAHKARAVTERVLLFLVADV